MKWDCGWAMAGFKEAKRENTSRDMEKHEPRQEGKVSIGRVEERNILVIVVLLYMLLLTTYAIM